MSALSDAIAAIKAGRLHEGRVILAEILARDGNNVTALLWMTEVAATPEEVRRYLKRVLALDPANAAARRGIALLDKADEQPPLVATGQPSLIQPASAGMVEDHTMSPDERRPQEVMRPCPHCQKAILTDSSYCRFCGYALIAATTPVPNEDSARTARWPEKQKTIYRWIIVLGIALLLILILVAVAPILRL
jgi:hypothetical protein